MKLDWKKGQESLNAGKKNDILKKKILIADDEEPNLRQIEGILSRHFEVITAVNGLDALAKAQEHSISAIVSDQRMPEMTGTELFAELAMRQHPAPRIILTGYAEMGHIIEAINSGHVFRYLTKPIVQDVLISTIEQAIEEFEIDKANTQLVGMVKGLMEDNALMASQLYGKTASSSKNPFNIQEAREIPLAILMADIRDFSKITLDWSPEQIIALLQLVFSPLHRIVHVNGGIIDKHMGDTMLALFGFAGGDGLRPAIRAAKFMTEAAPKMAADAEKEFGITLQLAVGVAVGDVVAGMLGSDARSEMAIIGESVNLAHRLQEAVKALDKAGIFQKDFISASHCITATLPELVSNLDGFREIALPDNLKVRNFEKIEKLAILLS